ncbi:MAG: hypothetical protein EBX17_07255 [Betaproteobacteria bacterium]|nr:hypothetical protein [Betaproteobacteria bacterium]
MAARLRQLRNACSTVLWFTPSAAAAFLRPVEHHPRLTLRLGVLVTRVLIEQGRAVGVVCRHEGEEITLRCDGECQRALRFKGQDQRIKGTRVLVASGNRKFPCVGCKGLITA